MPAPRVLFVKLTSLGDVIHLFPAITDLRAHRPEIIIDWAVEQAYAPLVRLHPAVDRTIPVALRSLRAQLFSRSAWETLAGMRRELKAHAYDWVVDAQGLLKSVAVAKFANGPLFGYDRKSIRERAAARFCDVGIAVSRDLHAVDRNRRLVGAVFGYRPEGLPDYGLKPPPATPVWVPECDYIVALHASSRRSKRWPDNHWTALARKLRDEDIAIVYPGGTDAERKEAALLADGSPGAMAAPAMGLPEAAALLARASAVVGVDTGLTHLAVALGTPTVGLYVATDPGLTGLNGGDRAVNLGGPGHLPGVDDVARVLFGASHPQ